MMIHVKVRSSTSYHISLVKFGGLPMDLSALKLAIDFQQWFTCLPSFWLVNQATFLSQHLVWHLEQNDIQLEGIMGSTTMGNSWHPNTPKNIFDAIKHAFIAKERNSFHLMGKILDCVHPKDFLNFDSKLYSKQALRPPQHKILVAYCTSNYKLIIEMVGGRLSQSLGIKEYANFVQKRHWKTRCTLCWSTPSTTPLEIGSLPYFIM